MARYIVAAVHWRRRRLLQRMVFDQRARIARWQARVLEWEREIAELTASIDAALDDGVDLMADRKSGDSR